MTNQSDRNWIEGQASEGIVTIGDPKLKQRAELISDVTSVRPQLDQLVSRLRDLRGAGLAAPQVGWPVAAVVVEVRKTDVFPDRPESPLIVMVNPEIVERSDETEIGWEGCFSVPGLMGEVARPKRIRVRFLDPDSQRREDTYDGYLARVIQHEIDHLNAVEFLDHMSSPSGLITVRNYIRFYV